MIRIKKIEARSETGSSSAAETPRAFVSPSTRVNHTDRVMDRLYLFLSRIRRLRRIARRKPGFFHSPSRGRVSVPPPESEYYSRFAFDAATLRPLAGGDAEAVVLSEPEAEPERTLSPAQALRAARDSFTGTASDRQELAGGSLTDLAASVEIPVWHGTEEKDFYLTITALTDEGIGTDTTHVIIPAAEKEGGDGAPMADNPVNGHPLTDPINLRAG